MENPHPVAEPALDSGRQRQAREFAADGYALELTGDPGSFVSAMTRLTDQNLAEAEPGRWVERLLHDHPGYNNRVEHARRYMAAGNKG